MPEKNEGGFTDVPVFVRQYSVRGRFCCLTKQIVNMQLIVKPIRGVNYQRKLPIDCQKVE